MTETLTALLAEYWTLSRADQRAIRRHLNRAERKLLAAELRRRPSEEDRPKAHLNIDLSPYSPCLSKAAFAALSAPKTPHAARAAIAALAANGVPERQA